MRCSEPVRRGSRAALRLLVGTAFVLASAVAGAHKASDAYLQIAATPDGLEVRWDIALRDLDVALDLDADGDGKLTWGEVRAAWPRIESYALPRLAIEGCALAPVGRGLERRNDGAYAVLRLRARCELGAAAPRIAYRLFADVDPTHRGLAKVERAGQQIALLVLEPSASKPSTSAGAANVAGTTPAAARASMASPSGRWEFLREGVRHILGGYDHVLFLLCLLLPSVMRRTPSGWQPVERLSEALWPIAGIVSAFTVAHSITLGLAALKLASLPSSFIEPAIAATIVLAALDNLRPIFPMRRIVVTFCFGLVHGFGFAGVLAELALPRADFAWALLQFNLGLELGQLAVVAAVATALFAWRRRQGYARLVIRGGSGLAMAVGLVWLVERVANVSLLPF